MTNLQPPRLPTAVGERVVAELVRSELVVAYVRDSCSRHLARLQNNGEMRRPDPWLDSEIVRSMRGLS